MDGVTLEGLDHARGFGMPGFVYGDEGIMEAWSMVSARYASAARGMIRVILPDKVKSDSVWNRLELPALLTNPDVTNIIRVNPDTGEQSILY